MRRAMLRSAIPAALLMLSAIFAAAGSNDAPFGVALGLFGTVIPLIRAWRTTKGSALRPALVWAAIALGLAMLSQVLALSEIEETGRPVAGQVVYLSTLAAFATTISVLNARTPGGGAWSILMALLVVVFLVPWLEAGGLAREANGWDRLRLSAPWTIFYGLIVLAGVTNYLPTRYGQAAFVLGLGFFAEYLGLTRLDWSRSLRGCLWSVVPALFGITVYVADYLSVRNTSSPPGLERLWSTFRDSWGVVWGLRVLERFNRAAETSGWPIRLTWQGVLRNPPEAPIPPEAEAVLAGLLRRFASPEWRGRAATANDPGSIGP